VARKACPHGSKDTDPVLHGALAPWRATERGFGGHAFMHTFQGIAVSTADVVEGITSFLQKRKPEFKGQ